MKKRKALLVGVYAFLLVLFGNIDVYAATKEEIPVAVLYSASDFQNPEGHMQGAYELETITKQIDNDRKTAISEAFICGDYYYDDHISAEESSKGIEVVHKVLNSRWNLDYDEIFFVQGNHDPANTAGLDNTGGTERAYYNVYQINHDDYMWSNQVGVDIESHISETAEKLREWLDEKADAGDLKPIFIITHLPLHHSYRYDNPYAEYLFDVINEAGARGLNIVYLFGHNHSREYDNYLGGGSIYLSKGDEMILPDIQGENAKDYKSKILNFTYLNAGYMGEVTYGALSSCVFEIYEDRIEILRYTKDGIADLKTAGISSENDLGWKENQLIKKSPQAVELNQGIVSLETIIDSSKLFIDINESADLQIKVEHLKKYDVIWKSSNPDVVEISFDKTNAKVQGKKYGISHIEVQIQNLEESSSAPLELNLDVVVAPSNAVSISFNKGTRFYGNLADISTELAMPEVSEKNYMIASSDKPGSVKVFAAKQDEYVDVEERQAVYVPGVGTVLTENKDKNILWRFNEIEGVLSDVNEYQLQISPKSLYRYRYYIASTSEIDSGLGYPNLTNMRTSSKETSSGATLFWFDSEGKEKNRLVTTHHYKDGFKENENGMFVFCYDETNNQFRLSNQSEVASVYFYGRVTDEITDLVMWTDATEGKAYIGSESSAKTGGTIFAMNEETIEEITVTLEMLSGFEENESGKYMCTLSFNGEILSENYELRMKNNCLMMIKNWLKELF